jgi:peptidoglycan/LPS O-acetylase OafA/YrhL
VSSGMIEQKIKRYSENISIIHRNPKLNQNNFDLLRLIFAAIVCLVHAQILSGLSQLNLIPQILSSSVAVKAFFIVSGFLIFMSYERSASFKTYAIKRIRRIWLSYFVLLA